MIICWTLSEFNVSENPLGSILPFDTFPVSQRVIKNVNVICCFHWLSIIHSHFQHPSQVPPGQLWCTLATVHHVACSGWFYPERNTNNFIYQIWIISYTSMHNSMRNGTINCQFQMCLEFEIVSPPSYPRPFGGGGGCSLRMVNKNIHFSNWGHHCDLKLLPSCGYWVHCCEDLTKELHGMLWQVICCVLMSDADTRINCTHEMANPALKRLTLSMKVVKHVNSKWNALNTDSVYDWYSLKWYTLRKCLFRSGTLPG